MMKSLRKLTAFGLLTGLTAAATALEVDMPNVVSHNDVVYLTPARGGCPASELIGAPR